MLTIIPGNIGRGPGGPIPGGGRMGLKLPPKFACKQKKNKIMHTKDIG